MKYYIIAGEASGDLHGSNLIKALKAIDSDAQFRCWGGDLMEQQGAHVVKHYRDLAFMGFIEVLFNLKTILKNLAFCKSDIANTQPDAIVLVDYPGFNLKIAQWAKNNGFKVFYYISPQIWAWKQSRVHTIKKYVDKMFVILPFEKAFYAKFQCEVDFVGHPLLDVVHEKQKENLGTNFLQENKLVNKPIIAILPGSRKQEIDRMLPIMLSIAPQFNDYQFVIAGAPSIAKTFYAPYLSENIVLLQNKTYDLLRNAHACIVTSGTATLETALFKVPQVVCYKGNALSFLIAKRLVKVKFISLVNLIVDKKIVEELIQNNFNTSTLLNEVKNILSEGKRKQMLLDYETLHNKLGSHGASERTAQLMHQYLSESTTHQ